MGNCACDADAGWLNPAAPLSVVYLELTPACNNACAGCGDTFSAVRARAPLPFSAWIALPAQLDPARHRLRVTGGEPTLHPDFEPIVAHVAARGFHFSVFTNARWRDPARIVAFLADLLPGLECALISLHGAHAASHEAFTGVPGSYAETVDNIRRATQAGVPVNLSTVITQHNWREIGAIIALGRELGARQVIFNRYIGVPLPALEAGPDELRAAVRAVEYHSNNGSRGFVKFGTPIPHCFTPNSSNGCMAGFVHVTLDPWGNVRPCSHVPLNAGNLLTDPLDAIMQSETMRDWRSGYLAQCEGCREQSSCFAGCRAMALFRETAADPLLLAHRREALTV